MSDETLPQEVDITLSDEGVTGAKPRKKPAPHGELTRADKAFIARVDAVSATNPKPELPDDLALDGLVQHGATIKATRSADATAFVARKVAIEKQTKARKEARVLLRRAEQWLSGVFDDGAVGALDFVPPGPGPHDEAQRLNAFLSGLAKHPDAAKKLPAALTVKEITGKRVALETAVKAAEAAVKAKVSTGAQRATAAKKTAKLDARLVKFLRGWYGESSADLLAFGIKPKKG